MHAILLLLASASSMDLEKARDAQDLTALAAAISSLEGAARKQPEAASAQYELALARSYQAEVALELRDKNLAAQAADAGIAAARRAVAAAPLNAEYHRLLGTLCGQIIPANIMAGVKHGKCAKEAIEKAVQLDPNSARAWVSHCVGNYYLPRMFGGGVDRALPDCQKAVKLAPQSAEAHLWLGLVLRKAGRAAEAKEALLKSLEINPRRIWTKQQLGRAAQ